MVCPRKRLAARKSGRSAPGGPRREAIFVVPLAARVRVPGVFCATCGEEESEAKLPVYVAEQFPHMRVEACDTYKFYLCNVDLTKDGNAVPLVDDLAAIPLSLWTEEVGYTRAQANLLGT